MKKLLITIFLFLFFTSPLLAATLVEIKSEGTVSRIYSDGKKARMEADKGNYTIIDPNTATAYSVMDSERQVMKLELSGGGKSDTSKANVKIENKGKGPEIAGYTTRKYDFFVNGQFCGSLYNSKKAMKDAKLEPLYTFIQAISSKMLELSRQLSVQHDPCIQANTTLTEKALELGLSLKSVEKTGVVSSEIIKIEKRAKLPKGAFTVPADYKVIDVNKMHNSMQKELQGKGSKGTSMDEMMRQLQESGDFPPEMLEQMKQMQQK